MSQTTVSLAKITRPQLAMAITRERLLTRLDNARSCSVIWVSGPPGCGKTTLLSSYLELRKLDYLWYQLDDGDADVATFFYYLTQTAKRHGKTNGKPLPSYSSEFAKDIPTFSRRFFRNLFGRMDKQFLIILDNYNDVAPQSLLHEGLSHAFADVPASGCIVVISRNEPPAQMARLRANQQLALLEWSDLRMTRAEVGALADARGEQLTEGLVDDLHAETDGWAAGLILLLEQQRRGRFPNDSVGGLTPDVIFDYLADEVFRRFEEPARDFLMKIAWLPRMTVQMAGALTEDPNAEALLINLTQNNYFVTEKRERNEKEYQFHPLFREFLINESKTHFTDNELNEIYRRAGDLLLDEGCVDEAVHLLVDAGAWERLTGVIREHAASMMEASRGDMLTQWLENLPPEQMDSDPWLLYWYGASRIEAAPREARRHYEAAWHAFGARFEPDPEGLTLSCGGVVDTILAELDDLSLLDGWLPKLEDLLEKHPDLGERPPISRCMFMSLVLRRPNHPDIEKWVERSMRAAGNKHDSRDRIPSEPMIIVALLLSGEFKRARDLIEQSRLASEAMDISPLQTAGLRLVESMHAMLIGDGRSAQAIANDGLELLQNLGMQTWQNLLTANSIGGALAAGEIERAQELLSTWNTSFRGVTRLDRCLYHYFSSWCDALRKDTVAAYQNLKEALTLALEVGMPFLEVMCRSALAQTLFDFGDERKGKAQLRKVHDLARDIRNPLLEFMTLLNYAQIALAHGRSRSGLNTLEYAFGLGREYAFKHVLWWRPEVIAGLCVHALENDIETDYVRHLISTRDLLPEPVPLHLDSWPWRFRITTLGKFRFTVDGEARKLPRKAQGRPMELLKALIAAGGVDVRTEQLAETLWPHVDGDYAYRSLTTTLHRLRRMFGTDEAVLLQEGRVSLNPRLCWLDTWALDQVLRDVDALSRNPRRAQNADALGELSMRLLRFYGGAFLEDESDLPSYIAYRGQLRSRLRRNLVRLASCLDKAVTFERGTDLYEKLIEADPPAEELYRDLMQRYVKSEQRAEALAVFERCRRTLHAMKREPSEETLAIYDGIAAAP